MACISIVMLKMAVLVYGFKTDEKYTTKFVIRGIIVNPIKGKVKSQFFQHWNGIDIDVPSLDVGILR